MTKEEIEQWCQQHTINNYTINPDMSIDVKGGVSLTFFHYDRIPVKFNKVKSYFDCSSSSLTTLEGCPNYVGTDLYCYDLPELKSLDFIPKYIGGDFYCDLNMFTTRQNLFLLNIKRSIISDCLWKF